MIRFLKTNNITKRVYDSYFDAYEWVDYVVSPNEEFDEDEVYFEHLEKDIDYEVLHEA